MTQQTGPAGTAGPARPLSQRRPFGDRSFQIITLGAGLLVLVILVLIAFSTTQQAGRQRDGLEGAVAEWAPLGQRAGGSGRNGRIHLLCHSAHDNQPI